MGLTMRSVQLTPGVLFRQPPLDIFMTADTGAPPISSRLALGFLIKFSLLV